jgi:hypothetical protein
MNYLWMGAANITSPLEMYKIKSNFCFDRPCFSQYRALIKTLVVLAGHI